MSCKDGTPSLFQNSESADNIGATSCSLSSATPPSGSSPRDTLTSLLLQIQQYHTAELQKLQDKVTRWKMKCDKLAKISNDNAGVAKAYYKKNKRLCAELTKARHQVRALQSPRQDGSSYASKIQADRANPVLPKVEGDARNSSNEDLAKKPSRGPSKLTSRKSNKKVRYAEISSTEGCHKHAILLPEFTEQKKFRDSPCGTRQTSSGTSACEFQELYDITPNNTSPGGNILAPDTCFTPSVQAALSTKSPGSEAMSDGHANSRQTPDGPRRRIKDQCESTVPETLGVDVTGAHLELDGESLMDSPTYASTPVGVHSQMPHLSDLMQVLNHKTQQTPDKTRLDLASSEVLSAQKQFTTPMPKSESQYPVDLSSTQAKSPTFCGEGLVTPGSENGKNQQQGTASGGRTVPKLQEGDISGACTADASYESEASILLFEPHVPKRAVCPLPSPQGFQTHTATSKKAKVLGELSGVKNDQEKTQFVSCPSTPSAGSSATAAVKHEKNFQFTVRPLKSQFNLSMMPTSKKRKLDDLSINSEEVMLSEVPEGQCFGKENSPEGLGDIASQAPLNEMSTRKIKQEKQPAVEKLETVKIKGRGSKTLKQSKLMLKIKPGMNRSAVLMREYNGGSLVSVDSQSDTYINQAIEQSLLHQKGGTVGGKNEVSKSDSRGIESEVIEGGFKIPTAPHRRQQVSKQETSLTEKKALNEPRVIERIPDLPQGLDITNSDHDLNGSIDPLLDLTRMEIETPCSPEQPRSSGARRIQEKEELQRRLKSGLGRGDRDLEQPEIREDSCLDLFEDEEMGYKPEGEMNHSAVTDETVFVKNFDAVPKVMDRPNYKYTEVVRKHEERKKLKGFGCKECEAFYGDLSLTDAERDKRMKMCSRHRAQFSPTHTPEHYWSVGFPDTQTCLQRGYYKESRSPDKRSRTRKKNKYKRLFSGKEDDGGRDDSDDGT